MLHLHRIQHFNEFLRCHASGEILMYGDFYYTDDDGKVISAKYYHNEKERERREAFDNTILETAQSEREYQEELKKAEQEYLSGQMLKEPVEGKIATSYQREFENG